MYYKCCVPNCGNTRKDAILHKFTTSEYRLQKWLRSLNLQRSSVANLYVCQVHFEKRFVGPNSRLLSKAYPSLFSQSEISSGISQNHTGNPLLHEHSYCRTNLHNDHNYCKESPSTSGHIQSQPELQKIQQKELVNENEQFVETSSEGQLISNKRTKEKEDEGNAQKKRRKLSAPKKNRLGSPTENAATASKRLAQMSTPTFKTSFRRRLIQSVQKLSPTAKKIYKEYVKAKSQTNFHTRARRALRLSKKPSFEKLTNHLNPYAQKFLNMQMKLCKIKKPGRRFTLDEKLIALSILKQSPKCYRFLHRIFILPSITTLNKMVSKLKMEPGINSKLFELIKEEVSTWKDTKKYCSIIFDEMAIGLGLSYNQSRDNIDGFVDLESRKNRFADHVLVFMIRGAIFKWQQQVSFYFCEGATSGQSLVKIIKDIVKAVSATGLKPIILSCDQGTAFQSALSSLKKDTKQSQLLNKEHPDDSIIIGSSKLNVIYDPSHLIKGIRNNFLTKDIKLNEKISKWQDIVDVYETDSQHTESRLLHKLTDEHVIPNKIKKMKVKNCVRVLSKTVAAALSYTSQFSHYVDGKKISDTIRNTAETVSFFDDLFDSINGSTTNKKKCQGKPLRTAVTDKSQHHQFWPEAVKKLESMRFMDKKGREIVVPTLKNFIVTIKSYIKLWQFMKSLGVKVMRPRYFNTDPIENFFGQVRAYNYRNNDPTCQNFINTFKALTLTRVLKFHSYSYNCEEDSADPLIGLQALFEADHDDRTPASITMSTEDHQDISRNIMEQVRKERLHTHSRAYTAGWILKKLFDKNLRCKECKRQLTSRTNDSVHSWISQREFKESRNKRKLVYPSTEAVRYFGTILAETNKYLEENAHKSRLRENISHRITSNYSFNLVNCTEHKNYVQNYFLNLSIRLGLFNWCKVINNILNGKDIKRLEKKESAPAYQKLALLKYKKKFKNKGNKT